LRNLGNDEIAEMRNWGSFEIDNLIYSVQADGSLVVQSVQ